MTATNDDPAKTRPTAAVTFRALWDGLSDMMGSSATATLLRRAAKHAAQRHPDLHQLVITRPTFEYEYIVPDAWETLPCSTEGFRSLVGALKPLLVELTGGIAINRLRTIPGIEDLLEEGDS